MEGDGRTYVKTCVDCGTKTLVIDSREQENGSIWRKRRCPKCGFIFTTIEVEECMSDVADVFDEITSLRNQNKKLIHWIEQFKSAVDVVWGNCSNEKC